MNQYVLSRECDACCGLVFDGTTIHQDPQDPLAFGTYCKCISQFSTNSKQRLTIPLSQQQPTSWEQCIPEIVQILENTRKKSHSHVALYLDDSVFRRSSDWIQSLSFAASIGSSSIFTDQCRYEASRLLVTEWMIGHATPLLSDLGRSHYILHLGSDHREGSWGNLQLGNAYEQQIAHSRKTKGTKLIIVNDVQSDYAKEADSFFSIRPGTEPFLLLGLLHVSIKSGWVDKQFVQKYTEGFSEIFPLISKYSVEECADICGISTSALSGIALKFTRSPMAVVHPNSGTFSNANATLGAWAWLALHTISANVLRPGGIYENIGALDLVPLLASLRTNDAPRSQVGSQPLLLMQNMGSQLLQEIEAGNISTLIIAANNIHYPQRERLLKALSTLECLIVISEEKNELTEMAHYVLPRSSSWEEDDLMAHRNICLPFYAIPYSKAIVQPPGEAKSLADILQSISKNLSIAWKGSPFGLHVRGLAKVITKGSAEARIRSIWNLLNEDDIPEEVGLNYIGESNRAEWRPVDGKIRLVPEALPEMLQHIKIPRPTTEYPFLLRTSNYIGFPKTNETAVVEIHSSHSFTQGEKVWLSTSHGKIPAIVELNENIREDSLRCSFWQNPSVLNLLPLETDPWSGTPVLDGVACAVHKRSE